MDQDDLHEDYLEPNLNEGKEIQDEKMKTAGLEKQFQERQYGWLHKAMPIYKPKQGSSSDDVNAWFSLRADRDQAMQEAARGRGGPGPGSKPAVLKYSETAKNYSSNPAFQPPTLPDCFVNKQLREKDEQLKEQQAVAGCNAAVLMKAGTLLSKHLELLQAFARMPSEKGISHECLMGILAELKSEHNLESTISHGARMTAGRFNELNAKRRAAALKQFQGTTLAEKIEKEHPPCLGKLFRGDIDGKVQKHMERAVLYQQAANNKKKNNQQQKKGGWNSSQKGSWNNSQKKSGSQSQQSNRDKGDQDKKRKKNQKSSSKGNKRRRGEESQDQP